MLGYDADSFGIWDRQSPGAPRRRSRGPTTAGGTHGSGSWASSPTISPVGSAGQQPLAPTGRRSEGGSHRSLPRLDPSDDQVLQYTHSGSNYLLGYGRTFFGIWLRTDPSRPLERFPRDDAGWAAAWRRFTTIETNYAEVGLGNSGSA